MLNNQYFEDLESVLPTDLALLGFSGNGFYLFYFYDID